MPNTKIACLGAGSQYFARALSDLAVTPGLSGSEVTLYDIDVEKAALMQRFGARLAAQSGTGLRLRVATGLADAVDGAGFAISSIGGGGASGGRVYETGYHVQDIVIPARYGIYQVVGDTCGPAGMMMAMRSIPIYLNICREMEKRCPNAILFNHSNPMAPLCRAMIKYTGVKVVGVCHGVQIGLMRVANILGVPAEELDAKWVGTNHYHWFTSIHHKGKDVYPEARRRLAARQRPHGQIMTQKLSAIYGYEIVYPEDDHILEFYPFLAQAANSDSLPYEQQPWVKGYRMPPPAPTLSEAERQARRTAQLKDYEEALSKITLPETMSSAITGEGLGSLVECIALGKRGVFIVNIANDGAVPNLPTYAVLEIEAVTDSCGVRGLHMGEAPLALEGLLHRRIVWQELVADAAAKGDRTLALQALLLDDLAILPEKAEAMLDELLAASKPMLPQFSSAKP